MAALIGENQAALARGPVAITGAWESYVAACGPQLTVCRKPMDAPMQRRWKTTLGYFDQLAESCREAKIRLALVIVPSPLQTNRPLLEAVCRRQGCGLTDVDLDLPQRRFAAYAAERQLPMLDLLPALRQCPEQPYIHQGWRWNDAGQDVAVHTLSGWMQSTFPDALAAHRSDIAAELAAGDPGQLSTRQR